jgi:hypothetical protein
MNTVVGMRMSFYVSELRILPLIRYRTAATGVKDGLGLLGLEA